MSWTERRINRTCNIHVVAKCHLQFFYFLYYCCRFYRCCHFLLPFLPVAVITVADFTVAVFTANRFYDRRANSGKMRTFRICIYLQTFPRLCCLISLRMGSGLTPRYCSTMVMTHCCMFDMHVPTAIIHTYTHTLTHTHKTCQKN